jgi:hypothetical protein
MGVCFGDWLMGLLFAHKTQIPDVDPDDKYAKSEVGSAREFAKLTPKEVKAQSECVIRFGAADSDKVVWKITPEGHDEDLGEIQEETGPGIDWSEWSTEESAIHDNFFAT